MCIWTLFTQSIVNVWCLEARHAALSVKASYQMCDWRFGSVDSSDAVGIELGH